MKRLSLKWQIVSCLENCWNYPRSLFLMFYFFIVMLRERLFRWLMTSRFFCLDFVFLHLCFGRRFVHADLFVGGWEQRRWDLKIQRNFSPRSRQIDCDWDSPNSIAELGGEKANQAPQGVQHQVISVGQAVYPAWHIGQEWSVFSVFMWHHSGHVGVQNNSD